MMNTNVLVSDSTDLKSLIDSIRGHKGTINLNVFVVGIDEATKILQPKIVDVAKKKAVTLKQIKEKTKSQNQTSAYHEVGCKKLTPYDWFAVDTDNKIRSMMFWDDESLESFIVGKNPKNLAKRFWDAIIDAGVGRELKVIMGTKKVDKKGKVKTSNVRATDKIIKISSIDHNTGTIYFEKV